MQIKTAFRLPPGSETRRRSSKLLSLIIILSSSARRKLTLSVSTLARRTDAGLEPSKSLVKLLTTRKMPTMPSARVSQADSCKRFTHSRILPASPDRTSELGDRWTETKFRNSQSVRLNLGPFSHNATELRNQRCNGVTVDTDCRVTVVPSGLNSRTRPVPRIQNQLR